MEVGGWHVEVLNKFARIRNLEIRRNLEVRIRSKKIEIIGFRVKNKFNIRGIDLCFV